MLLLSVVHHLLVCPLSESMLSGVKVGQLLRVARLLLVLLLMLLLLHLWWRKVLWIKLHCAGIKARLAMYLMRMWSMTVHRANRYIHLLPWGLGRVLRMLHLI